MGTLEAAQEEDGHPGGGRLTETREVTKERRAREETGHSHYGGPRWSQRREEPWRRSLRQRAEEQGQRGGDPDGRGGAGATED